MEPKLKAELDNIRNEFVISNVTLNRIANDFYNDMHEKTMLKMLNTYVFDKMDEILSNEYLSIDIGGSNIRISKLTISNGNISIDKMIKLPLRTKLFDYTSKKYTLEDLFEMILKKMAPFLDKEKMYTIAVTISFGMLSKSKTDATIIELSKGFELSETIGENVCSTLTKVIEKTKLKIIPTAIINDCAATLVAGKFYNPNADISLIVGTGHNACFINSNKEIINIESANFNSNLPLTSFDKKFMLRIPKEADNLFEVLIGGKYLSGIAETIMKYLQERDLLKECKDISTEDLTRALNGELGMKYSIDQKEVLKEIAQILFERSARLISAEIVAILMFIDKEQKDRHTVIIDGSVYEKCGYFRDQITKSLESCFPDVAANVSHKLIKDASSIGPAIVSASN